ncbi:hypothetical protein D3C87_848080 [compost metagenome]
MKPAKVGPGVRCVLIRELPGFEANVGALLTAVCQDTCRHGDTGWLWEASSRPLVVSVGLFTGLPIDRASSSLEALRLEPRMCAPKYPTNWLLPLNGEDLAEDEQVAAPMPEHAGADS